MCCPSVLLKCVGQWPSGMAPAFSISDSLEAGSRKEVLLLQHERGGRRPTALRQLPGAPTSHEGPEHSTGADLALSLLHVRKILFHLALDCVVFSSVTAIPGFSGQKRWTPSPGGWHCDDLCYHLCGWSPPLALVNGAVFPPSCMSITQASSTHVRLCCLLSLNPCLQLPYDQ